ncbi:putative colanic acid biosynthesis acetyltransferase WcaF [Pedobacter sp. CAN_A7]|uniref:WcaF family extracellular polysaccharide biosynthesis acetyltransferase n=1 Tax=Pedobacter sp. CAN_A7 TaxID=2787722 RepID=UPI0018C905C0
MKTIQLRKAFPKSGYNPGASALKIHLWYLTSLLLFRSGLLPSSTLLVYILRLYGARIGKDVRIKPFIDIKYPWKLTVGDHSWLGSCMIENLAEVVIGNHVCVSQHAMLLTGNHNYSKSSFDLITAAVVLEDGVWIGAKATVCPGTRAKTHSILTVGSVATRDMDDYMIYQGNPARMKSRRIIE